MKKNIFLALATLSMFGIASAHDLSSKDFEEMQRRTDLVAPEFSDLTEKYIKLLKFYDEGEHAVKHHKNAVQKAVNETANGGKSWFNADTAKRMVAGAGALLIIELAAWTALK